MASCIFEPSFVFAPGKEERGKRKLSSNSLSFKLFSLLALLMRAAGYDLKEENWCVSFLCIRQENEDARQEEGPQGPENYSSQPFIRALPEGVTEPLLILILLLPPHSRNEKE